MTVTREQWLNSAVKQLRPLFKETDLTVPDVVRVSAGFPGGRSMNQVVGQCWKARCANDGVSEVFISPLYSDPSDILSCLLHELIHAADDCESGHQKAFRAAWKALGFSGKPTQHTVGQELADRLEAIAGRLGEYPGGGMTVKAMKKAQPPQTTRMLKVFCEKSGYTARTTAKWLDEYGTPICPCHHTPMEGP